jgi:type 1 glutamine amidotransferase
MRTLGSTFVAHPPVAAYRVDVATPEHPLTIGIESFETNDEQYLVESYGELQVLLDTHFEGIATGFVEDRWPSARHPVFYINAIEKGAVLYLTLGHCRGHYDMQPLMDFYPHVENGSWDLPVFYDLLRRGIQWCSGRVSEP